jgi:hypothetical protein
MVSPSQLLLSGSYFMPYHMANAPNPLFIESMQWLDFCRCATELGRRNMEDARRMRARLLEDASFCIESYMRSPLFLELMRCNVAMAHRWSGRPGFGDPSVLGFSRQEHQS